MKKTIHRPEYRALIDALRARREALDVSQDSLAKALGWSQQKLSATESCSRRLDVLEFLALASALGLSSRQEMGLAERSTAESR